MAHDKENDGYDVVQPSRIEYFPWHFSDKSHQPQIRCILNIHDVWQRVVLEAREPNVARLKLAWWREELIRMKSGQAVHAILAEGLSFPDEAIDTLDKALDAYDQILWENSVAKLNLTSDVGPLIHQAICLVQDPKGWDAALESFCQPLGQAWLFYL
ncbi:MAG: hypothetical protein AAF438_14680, partial [Pseudomonadota bacterium]